MYLISYEICRVILPTPALIWAPPIHVSSYQSHDAPFMPCGYRPKAGRLRPFLLINCLKPSYSVFPLKFTYFNNLTLYPLSKIISFPLQFSEPQQDERFDMFVRCDLDCSASWMRLGVRELA